MKNVYRMRMKTIIIRAFLDWRNCKFIYYAILLLV